jgi:hypothetical protein
MNIFGKSNILKQKFKLGNYTNNFFNASYSNFFTLNKLSSTQKYKNDFLMEKFSAKNSLEIIKYQKFNVSLVKMRRKKTPDPKYKMKTKSSARKRIKIVK